MLRCKFGVCGEPMRRLLPYLLLGAIGCAFARDVTYKAPKEGATATIRLSAPDYASSGLLRTEHLSMVVQRVERTGRRCEPETLGWIDFKSKDKTYAIAAGKIGSFGIRHERQTLTRGSQGKVMFAFVPEPEHSYEFEIAIAENKVDVKVYDETAGRIPVPVEMHYLMICARLNAAEFGVPQK
jgi:hypothetical protein